jgi:hypothetical protein
MARFSPTVAGQVQETALDPNERRIAVRIEDISLWRVQLARLRRHISAATNRSPLCPNAAQMICDLDVLAGMPTYSST